MPALSVSVRLYILDFDILTATSGFTRITQSGTLVDDYPIWMIEQKPDHTYTEIGESLGLEQVSASRAVLTTDINKV